MEINENKLRQYFLHNLPSNEIEEIELGILSGENFVGALDAAETDLIEDYLENTLLKEDLKLFEENYLITDDRRNRVDFLGKLKGLSKKSQVEEKNSSEKTTLLESLKIFLTPFRIAFALLLVGFTIFVGISFWKKTDNNFNQEIASINQRDFSNLDEFKKTPTLNLIYGNLRSAESSAILIKNDLKGDIFFRLGLSPDSSPLDYYKVSLLLNQTKIFALDKVKTYENGVGKEIRIIIPSAFLKEGNYQMLVENEINQKLIYSFSVQ